MILTLRSCPICRDPFLLTDNLRTLKCQHIFHYPCIKEWYQEAKKLSHNVHRQIAPMTCPLCRQDGGCLHPEPNEPPTYLIHTLKSGTTKTRRKKWNILMGKTENL